MNTMAKLMIVAAMLCVATLASAQTVPPSVFHYQGRVTGPTGAPLTTPQNFWFSIYRGGSATVANSGTLLYQETTSIIPDTNGIFEFLVGTGTKTNPSLSIKASDFNTTQTIFLQVAVGSIGNVLLPRTRFTTTPYSIVSSNAVGDITPHSVSIPGVGLVINSKGQWVGPAISTGAPVVSTIKDVTGGATVSGDLIQLSGSGLSRANVFVAGKAARVKSSSGSQLTFQVPPGLPIGLNQVSVSTGTLRVSRDVGSINLTRYLMLISLGDDKIVFINPANLTVVGTISINFGDPDNETAALRHIQVDFARDGALMLVPDNRSSQLYAVDLTKNPPALVQTLNVSNVNRTTAAAVEPSETIAAIADPTGNRIRIISLNESFPPFTAPMANTNTSTEFQPQPPAGFNPRTLRFASNQVLIADGAAGRLQVFQHRLDTNQDRFEWFLEPSPSGYSTQLATSGTDSFQMDYTADRDRLVILNAGVDNLQFVYPANWFTSGNAGASKQVGQQVYQFSLSNNNWIVNASQTEDLLRVNKLTDDNIVFTNVFQRQPPQRTVSTEAFRFAAIEPVDAGLIAAYVNSNNESNEALIFYRFVSGTLDRVDEFDPLDSQGQLDSDGRFPLNNVDTLGDMRFLP